ncbi:MAG TPA: hypothetical protein DDY39_03600, partial [Nitrospira sp.]|nr:hypothetical protein [Nitrospira sp.]
MHEICVIYLSEDEFLIERLVSLLRKQWNVWWAKDIAHGDWEEAVREAILKSSAVVPVLSAYARGERKTILKDEMRFAKKHKKPLFPFLIGAAEVPFGFGDLNHTKAHGWAGEEEHAGYQQLMEKVRRAIGKGHHPPVSAGRAQELSIGRKTLKLPAFVFSLSSHE